MSVYTDLCHAIVSVLCCVMDALLKVVATKTKLVGCWAG